MTLTDQIAADIRENGPMRLDTYMATCLLHPQLGYYTTRDPFGAAGDFITAPEISQMFGELIGLSLAQTWISHGRPASFTLAELGPGRGTLMADALRACAQVPGFLDAAQIVLVEVSEVLKNRQAEALAGHEVAWLEDVGDLPQQPLYLIANEFFDALPVRQFVREGQRWRERQVGLEDDRLVFGLGPAQPQPALAHRLEDTAEGDLVETCTPAASCVAEVAARIENHGGAALIIDYGDWRSQGDTFQALKDNKPTDPLSAPGTADLTAHVDFEGLAVAAAPCPHTRVTPQGVFLERLGITARAQKLAEGLSGDALAQHVAAHRRLTHPEERGNLFKVMALYHSGSAAPAGLDP